MSFLCFEHTQEFVAETIADGLGFKGVSFDDTPLPQDAACARCDKPLPETPELEAASRDLLMEVS